MDISDLFRSLGDDEFGGDMKNMVMLMALIELVSAYSTMTNALPTVGALVNEKDIAQVELVRLGVAITRPELQQALGGLALRTTAKLGGTIMEEVSEEHPGLLGRIQNMALDEDTDLTGLHEHMLEALAKCEADVAENPIIANIPDGMES